MFYLDYNVTRGSRKGFDLFPSIASIMVIGLTTTLFFVVYTKSPEWRTHHKQLDNAAMHMVFSTLPWVCSKTLDLHTRPESITKFN